MKPRSGHMRGQIAVLMTITIAALLGAMALGTDVAVMYFNWIQLQKAADAAALAGANYLGPNPQVFASTQVDNSCTAQSDDPKKAACTYAVKNGMSTGEITLTEPNPSKPAPNIEVSLTRSNLTYFFGKVIGLSTYSVAASATAQSNGPVGTVYQGLFPVGIQCNTTCSAGCTCTTDANGCQWSTPSASCTNLPIKGASSVTFSSDQIWLGTQGTSAYSAGNWGWLNLPVSAGCTAPGGPLAQAIACGASVSESITSVITKPGQTVGQIYKGWSQRLTDHNTLVSNNSSCNISYSSICAGTSVPCPNDPLAVVVPMVNYGSGCNGQCSIPVTGFALIYLDPTQPCMVPGSKKAGECPANSANAEMESCFLKTMARDTVGSSGAPNVGATSAPVLVQ
jgi:hypothetical protein